MSEEVKAKEKSSGRSKVFTVIGIILCIILLPILIVNVTMIAESYIHPDRYPSFAGYNLMIVLSPSMEDTIMTGDLIVVKNADAKDIQGETAEGAQDGDIISFFDPDSSKQSVLTHRCVKVSEDADGNTVFITKGDNNNAEDPTPAPAKNLIGTYITRIPGAGNVAMWLQTTPGLIVCVAVPIVLLVAYDLIMKKRYDKKKKKDTDALLAELEALRAQQSSNDEKPEEAKAAGEVKEEAKSEKPDTPSEPVVEAKAEKPEAPAAAAPEATAEDSSAAEPTEKDEEEESSDKPDETPADDT